MAAPSRWHKKTIEAEKNNVLASLQSKFDEALNFQDIGRKYLALEKVLSKAQSEHIGLERYIEDRAHWGRGKAWLYLTLGIGTACLYPIIRGPFDGRFRKKEMKKHTSFFDKLTLIEKAVKDKLLDIEENQIEGLRSSAVADVFVKGYPRIREKFAEMAVNQGKHPARAPRQRGLNL